MESKAYHLSKAQVANIKMDKGHINSVLDNGASEEVRRLRKPEYNNRRGIYEFLKWLRQCTPVSMAIIQEEARVVARGSRLPDFKASTDCTHGIFKNKQNSEKRRTTT